MYIQSIVAFKYFRDYIFRKIVSQAPYGGIFDLIIWDHLKWCFHIHIYILQIQIYILTHIYLKIFTFEENNVNWFKYKNNILNSVRFSLGSTKCQ